MAMKKFPNIRSFAWNSSKQQKWSTTIQKSASGRVRTMTNQLYPEWVISASYDMLTDAEANTLSGFVALLKGSFEPFLWLDPEDHKETAAPLAEISSGKFQTIVRIGEFVEYAAYIENVTVYVDGVAQETSAYTVSDGIITFKVAPTSENVTADYIYYWKVMLSDDGLTINKKFRNINKCTIKMVVAR